MHRPIPGRTEGPQPALSEKILASRTCRSGLGSRISRVLVVGFQGFLALEISGVGVMLTVRRCDGYRLGMGALGRKFKYSGKVYMVLHCKQTSIGQDMLESLGMVGLG